MLPNGDVREFAGDDLDLIADAEGITGFITQITLQVRPLEKEMVVGALFANARQLATALRQVVRVPHEDPTEYALNMWATFEAMINMLKSQPMANLFVELFPQMVDAMPLGMGGMMRGIGKLGPVGGLMLKAMKPMFPILFPILMPGMMSKVMPDMLVAVEKRVPMPDSMKEQMPDLMPAAMDNLMPKMLPSIVPLISDRLIEYLRE